jgi:hypothetical protein
MIAIKKKGPYLGENAKSIVERPLGFVEQVLRGTPQYDGARFTESHTAEADRLQGEARHRGKYAREDSPLR